MSDIQVVRYGNSIHSIPWGCRPQQQQRPARVRPRALGAALEAAVAMARGPIVAGDSGTASGQQRRKGRVLLIATGPATLVSRADVCSLNSALRVQRGSTNFLTRSGAHVSCTDAHLTCKDTCLQQGWPCTHPGACRRAFDHTVVLLVGS